MRNRKLKSILLSTAALIAVAATVASTASMAGKSAPVVSGPDALPTKTPIKHLVVVFNENRSFDHYFGAYPKALNVDGEPAFIPANNTPTDINNLRSTPGLLDNNPNLNPANGAAASNPFRLDRTQANTADQNHGYTPEQQAYDGGKNDLFPLDVGKGSSGGAGAFGTNAQVMGYFDGNTVTALWNYAQNYAMSDNAWDDHFGPSTPGALNMFAGQTNGFTVPVGVPPGTPASAVGQLLLQADAGVPNSDGSFTLIGDIDPAGDVCSSPSVQVQMTAKNIGDMLNTANIPWGSFVGGFNLQAVNANGSTGCHRSSVSPVTGGSPGDYVPHHIWFQYYASTSNPTHVRPASTAAIGHTMVPGTQKVDPANHAYDYNDFSAAVRAGNYPAVSFIKMPSYQDSHPGNSNPLDEQTGLVNLINFLQQQPDWDSTAVIVTYDDSDGWYDHAAAPISRGSFSPADVLNGTGNCGIPGQTSEPTGLSGQPVAGRCGPGTRLPFMVISPYAKKNYVSHVQITQASIPRFIEDNWLNGQRIGGGSFDATSGAIDDMFNFDTANATPLILDPTLGTVVTKTTSRN
ncbi:alkaline phosphatase family protein [Bradyrhizobium sp. dw_78]|uniref:phospholipase C n=1 Tax=Bradyrhizobium sp. dw_78 TaxID=2719793 RepID=UPI001BD57070|nr:alkaline phosphatase family protein [Bradyrhizobium sp. dw_78]